MENATMKRKDGWERRVRAWARETVDENLDEWAREMVDENLDDMVCRLIQTLCDHYGESCGRGPAHVGAPQREIIRVLAKQWAREFAGLMCDNGPKALKRYLGRKPLPDEREHFREHYPAGAALWSLAFGLALAEEVVGRLAWPPEGEEQAWRDRDEPWHTR
jgi:hypothetical protein